MGHISNLENFQGERSMSDTVRKKTLPDGSVLKLVAWISDSIDPGRAMHQLKLVTGRMSVSHPVNFEDFSKDQIHAMYHRINSSKNFLDSFDPLMSKQLFE
jgi:hypothetical protein